MNAYVVKRVSQIDWNQIEKVELIHQPWLEPCDIQAWAQACHDGEALYVRMTAREEKIRATLVEPLSAVCQDSCLEFFFSPCQGDLRYFNFEINRLGTSYVGFGGTNRKMRMRQIAKDARSVFGLNPFDTENGWGIEMKIPLEFMQMFVPDYAFEGEASGNFYKCGDHTEIPHFLAWSALSSEKPDFHRPLDFGKLIFE